MKKVRRMKRKELFATLLIVLFVALALPVMVKAEGATIWTDKGDYTPGETVTIYGSGFNPETPVNITVTRPDGTSDEWAVTSNSSGAFTTTYPLDGITGTYTVTAKDGTNTATTTFTDVGVTKPKDLTATAVSSSRIDLSWKDDSDNEEDFHIERRTWLGSVWSVWSEIATVSGSSPQTLTGGTFTYSNTGLTPNTMYGYRVRAHDHATPPPGGSYSGYTDPVSATTPPPPTADVTFSQVRVSSDFTGTVLTIDGTINLGVADLPKTYTWTIGDSHTFAYVSPLVVTANSKQYVWTSTSGLSTAQSGSITVASGGGSVKGNYKTQYYLTVKTNPLNVVAISGEGWYDKATPDTTVQLTAPSTVAVSDGIQWRFDHWDVDGSTVSGNPITVTMDAPYTATAHYVKQYYLTVSSTYDTPGGADWYDEKTNAYATLATGTVSGGAGTQYVFTGWSGDASGTGLTSNAIYMDGPKTATANWKTQYYITVTSAHDSPTASDWVDAGHDFTASVTSPTEIVADDHQWVCTGFSVDGGASQADTSHTFTSVQAPHTIVFSWKEQFWIKVNSAYDSPTTSQWVDQGGSLTVGVTSPADDDGAGTRYRCKGYTLDSNAPVTDGSKSYAFTTVQSAHVITFNWIAQYRLTVASDHDSPNPTVGEHWYDTGTSITASVTSPADESGGTRYRCTGWSGTGSVPASGTGTSVTFNIGTPSSITWNWIAQYKLTVYTNPASLDSPTGEGWYDSGVTAHVSTAQYASVVAETSRYRFDHWDGASGDYSDATVVMDSAKTATAVYQIQYYLTVTTSPAEVLTLNPSAVSGAGWYDSGATATVDVVQNVDKLTGQSRYDFRSWTGATPTGVGNKATVVMDAAKTATANYQLQYYLTVTSPYGGPTPTSGWFDAETEITASVTSPWPVDAVDTRYVCTGWTGTGSVTPSGTTSSVKFTINKPSSITLNWKTQYLVSFTQTGSAVAPTVDYTADTDPTETVPFSVWVKAGSSISYTYQAIVYDPTPGIRYALTDTSPASPQTANSPLTITGTYKTQYEVTFEVSGLDADATGLLLTFDSTTKNVGELPFTDWFDKGTTYTYSGIVSSKVADKQFRLDSATGLTSPIESSGTVTGKYIPQYKVTFTHSGLDNTATGTVITVAVAPKTYADLPFKTDWLDHDTKLAFEYSDIVSSSDSGKRFKLDAVSPTSPLSVTAPTTVTGTYKIQYEVKFVQSGVGSDFSGTDVTIDGTGYGRDDTSFWWYEGSSHDFAFASPLNVNGKRYVWTSTSGLSSSQSGSLKVTTSGSVTGTYKTQYKLTLMTDPSGLLPAPVANPASSDGFDDDGTVVTLIANTVNEYTFNYWSVDGTNQGAGKDKITVTMSAPHTAIAYYVHFTMNGWMTDSDFNPITAFDVVFTPSSGTTTVKLTATNPGTYYYTLQFTNNGPTINTLTIEVTIPADFVLKGAQPVQINFVPVSYTYTGGILTVPVSNVGTGQTFTLRMHLDYGLKGQTGFPASSSTTYLKIYSFATTVNSVVAKAPTIVATGKTVTAIGGFVTDTNGVPKNGLSVEITNPSGSKTYVTTGVQGDGFYFLVVPSGGPYTVRIYNSMSSQVAIQNNIQVAKGAFVEVDFNTLSPADPAIQGFITDNNGNPVAGVTVQLLDQRGKVVATTTTNAGGYYIFRFYQPGTYTVRIKVPSGYNATTASTTLTIKQFETATVNFTLTKR